jgi:hypothetical protein
MHAMVHSASVGPIRMLEWPALPHMLSVMVPMNVCWRDARRER